MSPVPAVLLTVLLACGVAACKDRQPVAPVRAVADATRDKEQAKTALMALPELQAWSTEIERSSHGARHPALLEEAPGLQTVNGKQYWELTYAADGADALQRRETFLVAQQGSEILVRDFERDTTLTLAQWRAGKPAAP
ncbi:MAG TPA: hypothetical protein VF663_00565 [Telluria sp.]|jgi:hypothetical protein